MLVTPQSDRRNRRWAIGLSATMVGVVMLVSLAWPLCLFGLVPAIGIYGWIRRKTKRRIALAGQPISESSRQYLESHVAFYRALEPSGRKRFETMVQVFLGEITITGVKTEVDDLTRVLVAASAVIPVFGFDDWEYRRLGEVLIYPGRFDDAFQTEQGDGRNTLGMIGVNHLSGVMILSKPDLIAGFANPGDKRNVGIHEFAHLVDKADGSVDGVPISIPSDVVSPWIRWVGRELKQPDRAGHIDDYAYTNEAEYFAVLTEYFFETPDLLAQKDPKTYAMLQSMYRQDTRSLLGGVTSMRPKRIGRNSPCPCGSGEKYKHCCRSR